MVLVTHSIESAIRNFRHEVKQSGMTTQLLLEKVAKPSERRKLKNKLALRRKRQQEKRRALHFRGNSKG